MGYLLRHPWRLPRLLGALPGCVRFLLGRSDPGAVKASLIHATLGGLPRAQLQDWTRRHLERVLKHALHADALRRLEQHRARGDYLVLLSASPDLLRAAGGWGAWVCGGVVLGLSCVRRYSSVT